jgi:hypothetical protein
MQQTGQGDDVWDFVIWGGMILFGVFVGIPFLLGALGFLAAVIAGVGTLVIGLVIAAAPFVIGIAAIAGIIGLLTADNKV